MSDERTTRVFLAEDDTLREERPDGPPAGDHTDWDRLDAMTDEEALQAALSDPDAQPLTAEALAAARSVPDPIDVRTIRRQLKMSQASFAKRFGFSLGLLREWEEGLRPLSRSVRAFLKVIIAGILFHRATCRSREARGSGLHTIYDLEATAEHSATCTYDAKPQRAPLRAWRRELRLGCVAWHLGCVAWHLLLRRLRLRLMRKQHRQDVVVLAAPAAPSR